MLMRDPSQQLVSALVASLMKTGQSKRRRGPQRMRRLDSITNSTDTNLSKVQEIVKDRQAWWVTAGLTESN